MDVHVRSVRVLDDPPVQCIRTLVGGHDGLRVNSEMESVEVVDAVTHALALPAYHVTEAMDLIARMQPSRRRKT